jgi:hypothetical protein
MTEPIPPHKILLIGNDPAVADEVRGALAASSRGAFDLERAFKLSEDLARLGKKG